MNVLEVKHGIGKFVTSLCYLCCFTKTLTEDTAAFVSGPLHTHYIYKVCSLCSHERITVVNLDCTLCPTHWTTCSCLINTPCLQASHREYQCWTVAMHNLSPDFLQTTLLKRSQVLEASMFLPYAIQVLNLRAEFPSYDPMLKWEPNVCLRFSSLRVRCLFWLGWNVTGQYQPALRRWRGAFSLALSGLLATSWGYLYAWLEGEVLWQFGLLYTSGRSNLPEQQIEILCNAFVVLKAASCWPK